MARFYVLPPRHQLGQRIGEFCTSILPGMNIDPWTSAELVAALTNLLEGQGAYLVFREELDESSSVKDALVRDFGATLDDEIIEVYFGAGLNQVLYQPWSNESLHAAA